MGLDLNNRPDVLFVIEWATVSLFALVPDSATRAQPWGRPDPSKPIFNGLEAENIRIGERFETSEKRPSGWKFPFQRHLAKEHVISIDKVWVTKPKDSDDPQDSGDYVIVPNRLMGLYIIWVEPPNGKADSEICWKSRTYYGVTGPEYNLAGTSDSVSFTGEQAFKAMFYKGKQGKGTPPPLSA